LKSEILALSSVIINPVSTSNVPTGPWNNAILLSPSISDAFGRFFIFGFPSFVISNTDKNPKLQSPNSYTPVFFQYIKLGLIFFTKSTIGDNASSRDLLFKLQSWFPGMTNVGAISHKFKKKSETNLTSSGELSSFPWTISPPI